MENFPQMQNVHFPLKYATACVWSGEKGEWIHTNSMLLPYLKSTLYFNI